MSNTPKNSLRIAALKAMQIKINFLNTTLIRIRHTNQENKQDRSQATSERGAWDKVCRWGGPEQWGGGASTWQRANRMVLTQTPWLEPTAVMVLLVF